MEKDKRLIWVDMEMTGLNPDSDRVIEIATIVTSLDLDILAEGPVIAIHQSDEVLAQMDEWNTRTHTNSGLVDRVRASGFDEASAAQETLHFLNEWAIRFVRIADSWPATSRVSRPSSTTAIST
jgi:oligoribonuclease